MYFDTYNQLAENTFFTKIYNPFLVGQSFVDECFWWNALDIARTSFKGIENLKFQLFLNSLHAPLASLKLNKLFVMDWNCVYRGFSLVFQSK